MERQAFKQTFNMNDENDTPSPQYIQMFGSATAKPDIVNPNDSKTWNGNAFTQTYGSDQ
jgi:hypothetical protein